jgi:hypothetical protein
MMSRRPSAGCARTLRPTTSILNGSASGAFLLVGTLLAHERYSLPAWAQHFVARVDHSPAR